MTAMVGKRRHCEAKGTLVSSERQVAHKADRARERLQGPSRALITVRLREGCPYQGTPLIFGRHNCRKLAL